MRRSWKLALAIAAFSAAAGVEKAEPAEATRGYTRNVAVVVYDGM